MLILKIMFASGKKKGKVFACKTRSYVGILTRMSQELEIFRIVRT